MVSRATRLERLLSIGLAAVWLAACAPSVKIEAPEKPIVINLNVKIEQEVRVRVENDLDSLFDSKEKIF